MTDPRYPIGPFKSHPTIDDGLREVLIGQIRETPALLRAAVHGVSEKELEAAYRPGGWTIRQVVHHIPDSHLNAYVRTRLAMTEPEPQVKPYDEARWAELYDARTAPIEPSLILLESLHTRWVLLLQSLKPADFKRTFRHPEHGIMSLDWLVDLYAWHGRHHIAQINSVRGQV